MTSNFANEFVTASDQEDGEDDDDEDDDEEDDDEDVEVRPIVVDLTNILFVYLFTNLRKHFQIVSLRGLKQEEQLSLPGTPRYSILDI